MPTQEKYLKDLAKVLSVLSMLKKETENYIPLETTLQLTKQDFDFYRNKYKGKNFVVKFLGFLFVFAGVMLLWYLFSEQNIVFIAPIISIFIVFVLKIKYENHSMESYIAPLEKTIENTEKELNAVKERITSGHIFVVAILLSYLRNEENLPEKYREEINNNQLPDICLNPVILNYAYESIKRGEDENLSGVLIGFEKLMSVSGDEKIDNLKEKVESFMMDSLVFKGVVKHCSM